MKRLLSVFFLLICQHLSAQITEKYYGTSTRSEVILNSKLTFAKGSIAVGYSYSPSSATNTDCLIFLTDSAGNLLWTKERSTSNIDKYYAVIQTFDSNFVAVGIINGTSVYVGNTAIVTKFNQSGTILWERQYKNTTPGEVLYDVVEVPGNHHIIAAGSNNYTPGLNSGMLINLNNTTGATNWIMNYDISGSNEFRSLAVIGNSVYALGFYQGISFYDGYLVSVNESNGNVNWSRSYNFNSVFNPAIACNWFMKLQSYNNQVYINSYISNDYNITGYMTHAVLRVDTLGLNPLCLEMRKSGSNFCNDAYAYMYNNRLYTVQHPGTVYYTPVTGTGIGTFTEATISKMSSLNALPNPQIFSKRIGNTGDQAVNSLNVVDDKILCGGLSVNDPAQIGFVDCFTLKSDTTLISNNNCIMTDTALLFANPVVGVNPFSFSSVNNLAFTNNPVLLTDNAVLFQELVICQDVLLVDSITAAFNMTMPSVCDSTIVQFNDMSVAVNSTISNWFWDFGDGNTSTSQNPLHNYLAAGAYNVQLVVNSSTGKTDTFLMVVTIVNNAMTVNAIANPSAVCLGDSVVLSASGASVYSWSGGVINNTPFVPLVSTIYSVTGTNAYGCTQTTTVLVTVHALPVVSISSVPNNTTVCAGNSITLSGSGALTYSWSGGISNGVNFTPSSGNTYTVVGTDANGCTNTSSISIQVNPLPVVTATASDNIICLGESLVLSGSGAVSYSWSGGVINGTPISPSASSVYTVTGTDANGCTGTSSVSITVNPLPNVTAVALPDIICSGNSSTLTATGANQYSWSGGVTNGVSFIPAATSTYTVTGVDMNGCSNTATVGITVNNTLNVTISPANPILCIGDDIQLLASGASSYNWMPNTAISSTTIADPIVSPTSTTTYTVTGSDAFGCTGSATITIEVIADPSVTVSKSGDIECGITSVQLSASGGNTFSWEPSWLVTNPASAFTYTNITEPTTFTVTATIGSCTVSDTIRVNVFNNDEAAIFIPNAFSPNGDGLNDCLTIRHKAKFSSYYFAIFNRWGQRVFEADVPEYCWDGQFQNEDAPFGSYYYFLRAETSCGKILKKGDISLIR